MAHILQLSDGTDTVDFLGTSGTSWVLLADGGLRVEKPRIKERWASGGLFSQGNELSSVDYDNRRVEITCEIVGTTWTNILDKKADIAELIARARESRMRPTQVAKVYLKWQLDTTSKPVYFDVLSGSISSPDDIMSLEKLNWMKGSQKTLKDCVVSLTCKPFARGDEVTLVNGTTIKNANDDTNTNYVALTGTSILGDVPGPLRIIYKDTTGSYRRTPAWIGIRENPTNFVQVLEAEDGTKYLSPSTSAKNTAYSGDTGDALGGTRVEWSTAISTSGQMIWETGFGQVADIQKIAGKVRAIAVGYFPTDVQFAIGHYPVSSASPTLYPYVRSSGAANYDNYILDLGVIDTLPFRGEYGDDTYARQYVLYAKADDTSSKTIYLDAIYFIPAEDHKYRKITDQYGFATAVASSGIEDDSLNNMSRLFLESAGTNYFVHSVEQAGLQLFVTPGVNANMYFLFRDYGSSQPYVPTMPTLIYVYHTPYFYDVRGT